MSRYQRNRGAGFEREIAHILSDHLGVTVKRKLGQARDSGDDMQVERFRIECKRRQSIAVYQWLEQCAAAAGDRDVPVVIARADGKEAVAILRLADFLPLMAGELGPQVAKAASTASASEAIGTDPLPKQGVSDCPHGMPVQRHLNEVTP